MKGIQRLEIFGHSIWYNDEPSWVAEVEQDPPCHAIDEQEVLVLNNILDNLKWFPGLKHHNLEVYRLCASDELLMSLFREYIEECLPGMKELFASKVPPVVTATRSVENLEIDLQWRLSGEGEMR